MSPALVFIGISVMGTWGLASLGLIAGGIILLVDPGDAPAASGNTLGGIALILAGIASGGLMQVVVMPLLGLDPPFPVPAKKIIAAEKLTRWVSVGLLRDLPNGTPKELQVRSRRVLLVRRDDTVQALSALCPHARLPMGGFPGSPIKPLVVRDDCVTCPFHGAIYEVKSGKVTRQPFTSEWNNDHPLLGRVQGNLFRMLSKLPAPSSMRISMNSDNIQTYPAKVEDGEVFVALPER